MTNYHLPGCLEGGRGGKRETEMAEGESEERGGLAGGEWSRMEREETEGEGR